MAKKQSALRSGGDYMMLNGEKVKLDLTSTDLSDRCKLQIAEILTGNKYELIEVVPPCQK